MLRSARPSWNTPWLMVESRGLDRRSNLARTGSHSRTVGFRPPSGEYDPYCGLRDGTDRLSRMRMSTNIVAFDAGTLTAETASGWLYRLIEGGFTPGVASSSRSSSSVALLQRKRGTYRRMISNSPFQSLRRRRDTDLCCEDVVWR